MKKRFSLRYKLILIFGLVVAFGSLIEGFLAVRIARNAILEKIEEDLIDKAEDTAEIINGRATAFLQFIEGIARMPILRDSGVALKEKLDFLEQEVAFNTRLKEMHFIDSNGHCVLLDGSSYSVLDRDWFRAAISGKRYISSPYMLRATGELIATFAVPIYDANRTVVGVLSADISGHLLSNDIAAY